MTQSMIERVAMAMRERYAEMIDETPTVSFEKSREREEWMECARAAIEAMREPSLGMLQQGHFAAMSVRGGGAGGQTLGNSIRMETAREGAAYRAMIDAALNEEVSG